MKLLIFFSIFLFLFLAPPIYILYMPKPINEGNCDVAEVSPDKAYKVITCGASYTIFATPDMYSLKVYSVRTRKLVYKDVFYFLQESKFSWECQNKVCKNFTYFGHNGGVTVNLPPNYWHQLRAKIPLWSGE